jgi:type II secretory pathway pseudopilin PulG
MVELLVVLALIGVLAGMTVPRLAGATAGRQLRQDARRLVLAARAAHDHAVGHQRLCRLMIDSARRQFALVEQDTDEQGEQTFVPLAFGLGRPQMLGRNSRFENVWVEPMPRAGFGGDDRGITFDELGQVDAAIITIGDGRRHWSLLTSPATGRIRLQEGVVDELPIDRVDLDHE